MDYLLRYVVPMILIQILAAYLDPRPWTWPRAIITGIVSVALFLIYVEFVAPLIPHPVLR